MSETTIERQPESSPSRSDERYSRRTPAWKKPWVWIVAVVVLAAAIAGVVAASGSGSSSSGSPAATSQKDKKAPPPAAAGQQPLAESGVADIGKPFTDGGFTFSVAGFDCSTVTAKGKTCFIQVTAQNTTKAAQKLTADGQQLFGAKGDTYQVDTAASGSDKGTPSLLRQFKAGESTTGVLAFVVPADTQLKKLELHGTASSQGAVITLP